MFEQFKTSDHIHLFLVTTLSEISIENTIVQNIDIDTLNAISSKVSIKNSLFQNVSNEMENLFEFLNSEILIENSRLVKTWTIHVDTSSIIMNNTEFSEFEGVIM